MTAASPAHTNDFRLVVDAQIALAMFLVRRDRPTAVPTKRLLLQLLPRPTFSWLWTPDILVDYERGASAIEQDQRLMRKAVFDRSGFQLLLSALQMYPSVSVSVTTLREVRQRMGQSSRTRERDLDDAIYLACAIDGEADVLTSQDSSLLSLGNPHEGVHIVTWSELLMDLQARGFVP
jgi:predicted nucleic acid-binding protein